MKFIFIRHGETYANVLYNTEDRILIGALDNELTQLNDKGRQQALNAKLQLQNMHIDEIYCSDLSRTKETASIIFPNQKIYYTALLRERSLGSDEGKRVKDLFVDNDIWKYHVNIDTDSLDERLSKRVPDGENYLMAMDRCKDFLKQFDLNENRTIAVVAHFHLIRCMIYVLTQIPFDLTMFDLMIPNAQPIIYSNEQGSFQQIQD